MTLRDYNFFNKTFSKDIINYLVNLYPSEADAISKFNLLSNLIGLNFYTFAIVISRTTNSLKLRNTFIFFALSAFAYPVAIYGFSKLKHMEFLNNEKDEQLYEEEEVEFHPIIPSQGSSSSGINPSNQFINTVVDFISTTESTLTTEFNKVSEEQRNVAKLANIIQSMFSKIIKENGLETQIQTYLRCRIDFHWCLIGENLDIIKIKINEGSSIFNINLKNDKFIQFSHFKELVENKIADSQKTFAKLNFSDNSLDERKCDANPHSITF